MKKDFFKHTNKLKQLDKIEYLSKFNIINRYFDSSFSLGYLSIPFCLVIFLLINNILIKLIMILFSLIFLIVMIISFIQGSNAKKQLYNQFFKIEPKKREELKLLMKKKKGVN